MVVLSNKFASGTNSLALTEDQWSNVVAELGVAQTYYWTVGDADTEQPDPPRFAEWQAFSLPDGTFQILEQPASVTIAIGQPLNLNVGATSSNLLSYQWKFKRRIIPGAILSSLNIPIAAARNSGLYSVVVSDGANTRESEVATVKIIKGVLVRGPANRLVYRGKKAVFTVSASGTRPITYQWFFNGNPIAGATARSFTLPSVQPNQQGNYSVRVANAASEVFSGVATLTLR